MIFMAPIDEGKKAPAFTLKDQDGKTHRLSDYAGRPVILYFYPKDDTPGCTKESCEFRDNLPKFQKSKAAVFGVSILDEASKKKFADKFDLNFPLLADADHDGDLREVSQQPPAQAKAAKPRLDEDVLEIHARDTEKRRERLEEHREPRRLVVRVADDDLGDALHKQRLAQDAFGRDDGV